MDIDAYVIVGLSSVQTKFRVERSNDFVSFRSPYLFYLLTVGVEVVFIFT
jgi:hypothetical protein